MRELERTSASSLILSWYEQKHHPVGMGRSIIITYSF